MTSVSKNFYFDVLGYIVDQYNNTVHRTIQIKPIDAISESYAEYNQDSNQNEPKFLPKVGDRVRISKYKNIFAKTYTQNWSSIFCCLTAVENKIPDVSGLVKKTNYDTKIEELENKLTNHDHEKYITTPEFNTLAADVFNGRLAQANLITKTDFDSKLSNLNRKITSNKSKHLLLGNELKMLKKIDTSYFIGKSHFEEDVTQHYLVFQLMNRYFKRIALVGNDSYIYYWKSKELSDKRVNSIKTLFQSIAPNLDYYVTKTRVEFNGSCLKQDKITFNHGKIVNIYIVYEIIKNINISDYLTLENCLFGTFSLTKNAGIDKYKYTGHGIGFDRHGSFSFPGIGLGRNVHFFGVDMSSSVHVNNKKKGILILGKSPRQGLEYKYIRLILQSTIKSSV